MSSHPPLPGSTPTQTPANCLLDTKAARAYLNVGRDALLTLIRSGKIRALRLGRGYRIPLSELEAFVQRELAQLGGGERA